MGKRCLKVYLFHSPKSQCFLLFVMHFFFHSSCCVGCTFSLSAYVRIHAHDTTVVNQAAEFGQFLQKLRLIMHTALHKPSKSSAIFAGKSCLWNCYPANFRGANSRAKFTSITVGELSGGWQLWKT